MPVYQLGKDNIEALTETTFQAAGIHERGDLQRLLRSHVDVIAPDTFVITEEFGQWTDSRRRIDLLALDRDANLVVIELKRTEDGGHMELQAVRYAAMISAMTFQDAVDAHHQFLKKLSIDEDAQARILKFLAWDEPREDEFAQDVRIVLASAEFSKELTTAVLWLNERNLDITCVRLKPYEHGASILLDVQQIIPLPEAEEYRVRVREKQDRERESRRTPKDLTKYDVTLNGEIHSCVAKRQAILKIVKHLCRCGVTPSEIAALVPWRENQMFRTVSGTVNSSEFVRMAAVDAPFDATRFFVADEDLIHINGSTFAFSSQWGNRTYTAIKNLIAAFPDKGIGCVPNKT